MDITQTTAAKSDQQNFDDYATGPRTVTITEVKGGSSEQPVEILLAEYPGRPYKPSKSMRRVLVASWGPETSVYIGRKMKLVGDPSVKFGGIAVGGIKIAELSHIDKPLRIALTVSRGKKEPFTVAPLSNIADKTSDKTVDKKTGEITDLQSPATEFVDKTVDKGADKVTPEQTNTIGALLTTLGMTESAIQLAYVGDVVERPITSPTQLSHGEADRVIAYLRKDVEQMKANGDDNA